MNLLEKRSKLKLQRMSAVALGVLALLLTGCSGTKTAADVPSVGSCPAPKVAEWTPEDFEALADEIKIGAPKNPWETAKLRSKLIQILDSQGRITLWDEFPYVYDSVLEHAVLRAEIKAGCEE